MSETMRGDRQATRDLSLQSGASSSAGAGAGAGAGATATNLKILKPVVLPKRGAVKEQILNDLLKPFSRHHN